MRLYPDPPLQRLGLIARDLAVVLGLALFAKIGLEVHEAVGARTLGDCKRG